MMRGDTNNGKTRSSRRGQQDTQADSSRRNTPGINTTIIAPGRISVITVVFLREKKHATYQVPGTEYRHYDRIK